MNMQFIKILLSIDHQQRIETLFIRGMSSYLWYKPAKNKKHNQKRCQQAKRYATSIVENNISAKHKDFQ